MKIDHYALRVTDRKKAMQHFEGLGFTYSQEFLIHLPQGIAQSVAMKGKDFDVFISDGEGLSSWVMSHGSGIHHVAYEADVDTKVKEWEAKGIEFQTGVLVCPCDKPMKQVFTVEKYGVCHELIERNGHPGFCLENVKRLMRGK